LCAVLSAPGNVCGSRWPARGSLGRARTELDRVGHIVLPAAMFGYAALLEIAPIRRMLLAAFLSRVPMGILALATVLFLHQEHRSYAIAGLVGGTIGFGLAITAVLQARIVDRRGPASLAAVTAAFALVAVALVLGGAQGWPALVLAPLGLGVGALLPASSSIVRGQYSTAVSDRPELERSLFALDSALIESTYISGPALVALTVAVASSAFAIGAAVLAAVFSVATMLRVAVLDAGGNEIGQSLGLIVGGAVVSAAGWRTGVLVAGAGVSGMQRYSRARALQDPTYS
jgi:hypothetical protein